MEILGRAVSGGVNMHRWENKTIHIKKRFKLTDDTYILVLREHIDFIPGQFIMIENPMATRKPFILGYFGEDTALAIQVKGKGTRWIVNQSVLKAHYPLGKPFIPPQGKGITIVSPASLTFGCSMFRVYGTDVLLGSRKEILTDIPFTYVIGDSAFADKIREIKGHYDYYVVNGSRGMEKFVYDTVGEGVFVSLEEYMACGIGACKGCAIQTKDGIKHVCTDGPIFRGDEIWF